MDGNLTAAAGWLADWMEAGFAAAARMGRKDVMNSELTFVGGMWVQIGD